MHAKTVQVFSVMIAEIHDSNLVQPHSYGEYIFDHSWASLAMRFGHRYCELQLTHTSFKLKRLPQIQENHSFIGS